MANGQRYTFPRLEDVLAQPEFATLRQFLDSRDVDRSALQAEIDRLVDQAHQPASASDDNPLAGLPPELAQLLRPIVTAAAAGQDVEPLLAALRQQLVALSGEDVDATRIDALLEAISSRLGQARQSGEASSSPGSPEP